MRSKPLTQFQYIPFLLLPLIYLPALLFSQSNDDKIDKLAVPLYKLSQNNSREQVYIQLNKGTYEPGEDLWYKSYILNSFAFSPSTLSKTLYVRVIREGSTNAFWQERYEIINGIVSGHVYLPDTLQDGNYRLEAFTKASFNMEETEFKAFRSFRVVQNYKSLGAASADNKKQSGRSNQKFQFGVYPEGGKLISGVPGKFAFKAVDSGGTPVEVRGALLENGKVLQEFQSVHSGMGSVVFTPLAGREYKLQVKTLKQDTTIELRKISPDGISLRLNSRDTSNLEFTVARTSSLPGTKVYFRGHIRGKPCFLVSAFLDEELKIKVPLKNFAYQGIAEFTVFNEQFIPLAERLVYVNPQKRLYIKATLSKTAYGLREKGVLSITTTDEKGNPVQAELGISVYDKLYSNEGDPVNLLTYNFLSSQLRGRIYDPTFYFEDKNKGREDALDLLLLTQGWRNYVWNEENLKVEGLKKAVIFDETFGAVSFNKNLKQAPQAQYVNSFLTDERGKPKNSKIIVAGLGGRFYVSSATLKDGEGANIYLKPMAPNDFQPRIALFNPFLTIDTITKTKEYISPYQGLDEKPYAQSGLPASMDSRAFRLENVTVRGKGSNTFRDKYLGRLDSLAKIDLSPFICKHGQLNGYWPEFYCVAGNGGRCTDTSNASPVEGTLYAIRRYEQASGGAVSWVLKEMKEVIYHNPNKSLSEEEILKINNLTKLPGYYPQKEYYQPDYDKEPVSKDFHDARNTLVWAPSVITNEKGEATLSFFCSDISSGFVAQLEGLTKDGLMDSQKLEFRVLKGNAP